MCMEYFIQNPTRSQLHIKINFNSSTERKKSDLIFALKLLRQSLSQKHSHHFMSITKCIQATGGTEVLTEVIPCPVIPSQAPFSQIPPSSCYHNRKRKLWLGLHKSTSHSRAEIAQSYSEKPPYSPEQWDRGISCISF